MKRIRNLTLATALAVFPHVATTFSGICVAQSEEDAEQRKMRQLFAESQAIVEAASFYRLEDGRQVDVPLRKEPVFRHRDASRGEQGGGIWMVGDQGRPLAMTVLYTFTNARHWVNSVRSLSTSKDIGGTFQGGIQWRPQEVGVEFRPLPAAPEPHENEKLRFSQMKQQARRFSGHEFWNPNNSRFELRLLARELHRYQDPEHGILEGAVFSLAHNTNPEVYLLIEAQQHEGPPAWYYALARFGFAELHVNIDDEEVWQQPRLNGTGPSNAYFLFHLPRETPFDFQGE